MKNTRYLSVVGSLFFAALGLPLCSLSVNAETPIPSPAPAAPASDKGPADVAAVPLGKDGQSSAAFLQRHQMHLDRIKKGSIGLLFIGDSITAGWMSAGKEVWKKYYEGYNAANFGIGGDRTQGVLWRIENGELDGISPSVVVLLIGVNNGTDPGIPRGVRKVVESIHVKLPETKVLLLGIFPHGTDLANPPWIAKKRAFLAQVNKEIAALDDGEKTRFLDIGNKFLDENGGISKEIMPDGLHPGAAGYQIWADAMQPLLAEMMQGAR